MTDQRPVLAVVQARMGSTRLPGKVLAPLAGTTVLGLLLDRLAASRSVDEVVVATTTEEADELVVAEARRHGAATARGPVDDVLARFVLAVGDRRPAVVVRLTGDCPLTDPVLVDQVVTPVLAGTADVASNGSARYLRGFDVEAFTGEALVAADREAHRPHERVHVTPWLYDHPDRFRVVELPWPADHAHLRLTVDTADDLAVVREACRRVDDPRTAGWAAFAAVLEADPALATRNAHVRQKAPEEG